MATMKQITHTPQMKADLKKLSEARAVLKTCEDGFERDRQLLEKCRSRMVRLQKEIGDLMISVPAYEYGQPQNADRLPVKINDFLQKPIDEINRLLG